MRYGSARVKWVLAIAALLAVLVSVLLFRETLGALRSLTTLRRVDDHPLYVMTYYGDYGFRDVLREGIVPHRLTLSGPDERYEFWACSCFSALNTAGDRVFGRNFDWHDHPALLLFTDPPDGYASVSMVDIAYLGFGRATLSWSDRARLLAAPGLPFDGMNERGLTVGMMAVPHAEGGSDPAKVTLDSLHVIRLLLDRAADVDEALSLLQDYNVLFRGGPPLHYLISDASGNSAVIEYIGGEIVVLRNAGPWQVATNFLISEVEPDGAESPCRRYSTAYDALAQADGIMSVEEAMALLEAVAQPNTVWSVVYDATTGSIHVAMGRDYDRVHRFVLGIKRGGQS